MLWRSVGGLFATLLLSCAAFAANKPTCEPGATCALRTAREMTLQQALGSKDHDSLLHWMQVTDWLERVAPESDAAARARFDRLRKHIRSIKDEGDEEYGVLNEQWLASAMINAGLVAEPEKLATSLPLENRQRVFRDLATRQAELGHWREAVRFLELIGDQYEERFITYRQVMARIADAGRPEIIEESASLMKRPPEFWVPIGLALADLAAGREDAAIARAMAHKQPGWSVGILDAMARSYRDKKRELDALRIDGMRLDLARGEAPQKRLEEEYKWYFSRLVMAGQLSEALRAWPQLSKDDLNPWGHFTSLLSDLRKPEDIDAARKLLVELPSRDRQSAEFALTWACIFSGMVQPSVALKGFSKPDEAGRSFVEWLAREDLSSVDRERATALLAVSMAANARYVSTDPFFGGFYPRAIVRAQITLGQLENARASIDALDVARDRAELLLRLSVAHSKAGQSAAARAAKTEAISLFVQFDDPQQPDSRADLLLRAGMPDEAEAELRRIMKKDPLPPHFVRVAKPLLVEMVARGEVERAFRFALDWSVLHGNDPEAIGNFYSLLMNVESPPIQGPGLRQLRKLMQSAEDRY